MYVCRVKQQILIQIANDQYLKDAALKLCKGNEIHKDLYQFAMLQMAEKSEQELKEIKNLRHYVFRVLWLNATSETAPFKRLYKQFDELKHDVEDVTDGDSELIIKLSEGFFSGLEKNCKDESMYLKIRLLRLYMEEGSFAKAGEAVDMNRLTVRYNIKDLISQHNEYIINNL